MRKFMQTFFAFKTVAAVLTFFAFWAAAGTGLCRDAKTVAVLPFEMNSSQDLGFLQNGLFSMLSSRLSDAGKVDVLDRETVDKALAGAKAEPMAPPAVCAARRSASTPRGAGSGRASR